MISQPRTPSAKGWSRWRTRRASGSRQASRKLRPPPTAGEWRAACDAAVVSHYDFGVRATEAARRAQFTAQEPEDIFEGLAEDDMGARFSAVVVQASKKFAAEFPPLAQRTVATTLRVPRRPLVCCTKKAVARRSEAGRDPRPRVYFSATESDPRAARAAVDRDRRPARPGT